MRVDRTGSVRALSRRAETVFIKYVQGIFQFHRLSQTKMPYIVSHRDLMLNTVTKLRENGATVIDDMQELDFDTDSFGKKDNLVLLTDFKVDLANYLGTLEKTSVKSLADVIQ
jgi:hypothetical protein